MIIDKHKVKKAAKKEWDASAAVREEFNNDFDGFHAFKKAEAGGNFKMLTGRSSKVKKDMQDDLDKIKQADPAINQGAYDV